MPSYTFRYGHSQLDFALDDSLYTQLILPSSLHPDKPEPEIIREALAMPLDEMDIPALLSASPRVVIVVNDKTRPVPNGLLILPLLECLHAWGVKAENIRFLIGMGTHIPMPPSEFPKVLPAEIIEKYAVTVHDCDAGENLVFKGTTAIGTPVYVNRLFDQADLRIVVGNIEPHHFAGFSGGVKSAAIGVCGRQTITANHSLLLHNEAVVGNFETNPLRQDIEEIGRIIQVDLALNVVMNVDKQILHCFWGRPDAVMRAGIAASRQVSIQKIPHAVDLVIASAGGYPKDINLYQAQKAMTHASLVLKPGGILLLAAACAEGIGSQGYEDFMVGVDSWDEVMVKFTRQGFAVGPHKALQIARIAREHRILLLSQLPPARVEQLLLTPVTSIESGLELAQSLHGPLHSVAVLPFAVTTIPVVQEQA